MGPVTLDLPLERYSGTYTLTVVATEAYGQDTITRGSLRLWPAPADSRRSRINPNVTYPFYGTSDVNLELLGPVSLLHSPSSTGPDELGVKARYYGAEGGHLELVFGADRVGDWYIVHAGVWFDILQMDSVSFRGTWTDGAPGEQVPKGYFCAWRVAS